MTVSGYIRGRKWIQSEEGKVYEDTGEKVAQIIKYDDSPFCDIRWNERPCPKCGLIADLGSTLQPDPCLGNLGEVISACCGHGVEEGYIKFENGITIRGFFKIMKE